MCYGQKPLARLIPWQPQEEVCQLPLTEGGYHTLRTEIVPGPSGPDRRKSISDWSDGKREREKEYITRAFPTIN